MTRVLVTGASGLIGRHAVAELVAQGFDVHGLSRSKQGADLGATWHTFDVLDTGAHDALMDGLNPTHLLHLAWVTEHSKFWQAPENKDWQAASESLITAFQKYGGKRVVMAGSCAEYDWANLGDGVCQEFETPLKPHTLYGQVKLDTQNWLEDFANRTGLSQAWGRVFLVFGAGEALGRLVPSVALALQNGQVAECSSGRQIRDFMDATDVGKAFSALLMSAVQGPVNVASGVARPLGQVVNMLGNISGRPDLIQLGAFADREDDPAVLVADVRRLENEVGFSISSDFSDSLKRAYDHLGRGGS